MKMLVFVCVLVVIAQSAVATKLDKLGAEVGFLETKLDHEYPQVSVYVKDIQQQCNEDCGKKTAAKGEGYEFYMECIFKCKLPKLKELLEQVATVQ